MPFISLTRLKVRSVFYLPGFLRANEASVRQLVVTPGYLAGKELIDKAFVFWTVTAWEDEKAMKVFRNGEAHRKAMQKLPQWCSEAAYTHWQQDTAELPGTALMYEKIMTEGKLTKVRFPSPGQQNKLYPVIRWTKLERPLKKK
ncbi:MAG TPA: hypothetical protein VG738_00045 [Chitinophagaceae bacterium]|nr:hypothetical protein [Chitinophagaceae bacterium]